MNLRMLPLALSALTVLLLIDEQATATDPAARKVADTFLKHMSENAPIAGTFRIETITDARRQEEFRKKARAAVVEKGYGIEFGPDKPVLQCRFAWDGAREMLDTLSGSNVLQTFFRTPEAYLRQMEKLNFNLDKPGPAGIWRPASFYFLSGGVQPWSDALKDCKFGLETAPAGVPRGCVVLVAKNSKRTVHIVVDPTRGIYHGSRMWLADGSLLGEVTVEKIQENADGRVFPMLARAKVFKPTSGEINSTFVMSAREVSFPAAGKEFEKALQLTLPKGAVINDHMLSKQIQLKTATSITEILEGRITGEPVEFKTTSPPTRTQTATDSGSWFWPGFAVVMSLPLAIYLGYRGYTVCRMRGSQK